MKDTEVAGRDWHCATLCNEVSGVWCVMVVCVLSDSEKLTQRVKDELGITKYKPVQYDKLQAMVEEKKLYSEKIEHKVRTD